MKCLSTALASLLLLATAPSVLAQDAQDTTTANPRVKMETSLGDIVLELDVEKAPITVHNFLQYAADKFYDGTIFHRVMSGFMIQGGGFTPTIDQKNEGLRPPIRLEAQNGLSNLPGTIAMARMPAPHSATCQFFINVVDNSGKLDYPRPDGNGYAVFGRVVEGMDTVEKIRNTAVEVNPKYQGGPVVPVETVLIKSVRILDDYDVEYAATLAAAAMDEIKAQETAGKAAEKAGRKN